MLTDIINEAKMANAIVQEVLEFVRPIRLQVEQHVDCRRGERCRISWPTPRRGAATSRCRSTVPPELAIHADQYQLTQVFTNLLINAYEAMEGRGRVTISGEAGAGRRDDGRRVGQRDAVLRRGRRRRSGNVRRRSRTRSSIRSSPRRRRGRDSAWPSSARSSMPTTGASTCGPRRGAGPRSA